MYEQAKINDFYRPKLTIETGRSTLVIPIRKEMHHAAHAVHGSIYFKALDDAAFFAVNSLVEDVFVLTANFTLYFLKPVTSGTITAKGEAAYSSGNSFIGEAQLFDDEGDQVARGSGTFIRSKVALDPSIGYL
ncbi:MAG: PaaI family thioesterase [Chlamydiales bacterium]|nr:PaaI family thioesterase [Chlamydiia bacterium]MCP5508570.1 PaaI family thioesterase [Chlamydiales bacterium]